MYLLLVPYVSLRRSFGTELRKDDVVTIRNCPPVSALKRFKLQTILKSPFTERDIARARKAQEIAGSASTLS
jgi:small subunit ribosomal protein S17